MTIYEISSSIRRIMDEYPQPDERELTRRFLAALSENRRIQYYTTSQSYEAKIGADWLWVIFYNGGYTPFLVQAKKLKANKQEITSQEAGYRSRSGERQIDLLLQESSITGIPAIYILFSNQIQRVPCGSNQPETPEGVFVDSAANIRERFFGKKNSRLKHMPLSCMFACYAKSCNYYPDQGLCKICKKCKKCRFKPHYRSDYRNLICPAPFDRFMRRELSIPAPPNPVNDALLPLLFGQSVLQKHPEYVVRCLRQGLSQQVTLPEQIIITDYTNRHGLRYAQTIMGPDFEIDYDVVYTAADILPVLEAKKKEYGLFERIGLFGSCAKGRSTRFSDIDIALVFRESCFRDFEATQRLTAFIKDMIATFRKNVDFVDYTAAARNPASKDFIADIDKYIRWV